MPWIEATLRGQRVLARTLENGALEVSDGRVEIRYRANDTKAYRASPRNLVVPEGARTHPDSACADVSNQPAASRPKRVHRPGSRQPPRPTEHVAAEWTAYTDGACSGNPGPAGIGMVVIAPGGQIHEGYEYLGSATNNIAELTAVLRGMEAIPRAARSIALHTDSKYAIGVLSMGWKAKANTQLVARVRAALEGRNAHLLYVPGHAGVPMNERADALAREAILRSRSHPLPSL